MNNPLTPGIYAFCLGFDDFAPVGPDIFSGIAGINNKLSVLKSDLEMFANVWLGDVNADDGYNLYRGDDIYPKSNINFLDFTSFAENWMLSSYD